MTRIIVLQPTCKGGVQLSSRPRLLSPPGGSCVGISLHHYPTPLSVISEIDGFWRSLASREDVLLLRNPRPKNQLGSSNSDRPQMFWGPGLQT